MDSGVNVCAVPALDTSGDVFGREDTGIVLGAVAEEGMTVAWNGAAWETGGVLGGRVDAANDTEEE